jgi:hypothetical protein
VHPAALKRCHRLKLHRAAGLTDTLTRLARKCAKLRFTSTSILFNVNRDSRPLAELAAQHQIDKVLDRLQSLTASTDQAAKLFCRLW